MTKVSFASLNLETKGEVPFEFPFLDEDGQPTGITFKVLSAHSRTVKAKTAEILNEQRKALHLREMNKSGPAPIETDIELGRRLAACRLVGWTGIDADWTEELALELCRINPPAVAQIMAASDKLSNFTKA